MVGVYLVHHPLHNFSQEVGVGAYMVMGAYKVLYSATKSTVRQKHRILPRNANST